MSVETSPGKPSERKSSRGAYTRTNSPARLRVQKLTIRDFKAVESLELPFPPPRMKNDPDIIVMGSENGVGKTSVLEALAFLFWALRTGHEAFTALRQVDLPFDLPDLLVRAGCKDAQIEAELLLRGETHTVSVSLNPNGRIKLAGPWETIQEWLEATERGVAGLSSLDRFFSSFAGLSAEPLVLPGLLYFHSYRKVQEGRTELGMMVEDAGAYWRNRYRRWPDVPNSSFKVQLLRSLMSRGGLFENINTRDADKVLGQLNDLMSEYAHGIVDKLRPLPDNTVEFRVTPVNGSQPFPFDGLSSGQKEIISTLFLVWHITLKRPGLVLIDEPELHLNAQWHKRFIHSLYTLAPDNQYLIATHSEDIFASVEADRRVLLRPTEITTS